MKKTSLNTKWRKKILYTCLITLFIAGISTVIPAKPQAAELSMEAPTSPVYTGATFTVDWKITDVNDLFNWGIGMKWNSTLINCTGVAEGPFLKSAGTTLWVAGTIDNVNGEMTPYGATLIDVPTANGTGILATVTFKANVDIEGISFLNFTDISLLDSQLNEIPFTATQSIVTVIIPEFPTAMIVPLFMIATLAAIILGKKALTKKLRSPCPT